MLLLGDLVYHLFHLLLMLLILLLFVFNNHLSLQTFSHILVLHLSDSLSINQLQLLNALLCLFLLFLVHFSPFPLLFELFGFDQLLLLFTALFSLLDELFAVVFSILQVLLVFLVL